MRLGGMKRGAVGEVIFSHAGNGRAELCQSPKDRLRVLRIGLDEEIEVFGCARLNMHAIGMTAYDEVRGRISVEQAKKVFEVLGEHRRLLL